MEIQVINRGDSHLNTGDNPPKSGDNAPTFGDSFPDSGDNWSTETNERNFTLARHSQNGTVTSKNSSVTTNQSSVTKNGAVVTTLSPGWQSQKVLPQGGSVLNNAEFVTTAQPQPPKARSPNFVGAKIQVGDVCRYRGPDGAMKVTCWGKDLQVLAIENGITTVKAEQWVHTYQIEAHYLRKVR
ncbi:MAG: hypothetical protein HC852_16095 [Acaryochloridaceae cyanobacterium RU_4_10]|nr:hypothetical protein [Acaryochloridaceae cyanobacterium RU_4_10]